MLVSDPATAARRRFGADLTLPTEGRPATQVAAGSLENPKDRNLSRPRESPNSRSRHGDGRGANLGRVPRLERAQRALLRPR